MIHNNGAQMRVWEALRLDKVALELPPNDPSFFNLPAAPIAALGGKTAPSSPGGMTPPQNGKYNPVTREIDPVVVITSKAPPDRQNYLDDGGTITATPPPSITRQENQKGVVGALADWKDADVFQK